jgi:hypothetical protein
MNAISYICSWPSSRNGMKNFCKQIKRLVVAAAKEVGQLLKI